jgi:NAD(P)H-hydrate epimerase
MARTTMTLESMRPLLSTRPEAAHKGTFGHLFVIAGARGFTGAAKLTCNAAERSGVGLVTLGIPYPLGNIAAVSLTETMTLRLPATDAETIDHDALEVALSFAEDKQAVALGPGLSCHPDTVSFVMDFIPQCITPMVIDADGLNALAENPAILKARPAPAVLTPHPGELARLTHSTTADVQADRESAARNLAASTGAIVVLKGFNTIIAAAEGEVAVNTSGNNGLACAGSGDVLTGLIGGLLAEGMATFDAARLGVYVHGCAGEIAAAQKTVRAMKAGDVIDALPAAWAALEA